MKLTRKFALLAVFLLVVAGAALADPTYPQYTNVTLSQTGGPFVTSLGGGYNQWVTPLQSTNTGAAEENIWFVWTQAWVQDAGGLHAMTWNDGLSQFEYTDQSGLHTAAGLNQSFMISLASTSTNIPIPSGFGLSTADSVPAFFVGDLAPGATANWDVTQKLTSNVGTFYFNGSFVGQAVPEPSSLLLLGSGLATLVGTLRRRMNK